MNVKVLAIDPGAKHCGLAWFDGNKCVRSATRSPAELYTLLERTNHTLWVCEEYRIYKWQVQAFDPVLTVERIGVIKYLAKKRGRQLFMQPAMIKKVTRGHLNALGIKHLPGTIHAHDAELHGYHFLMKRGS